MTQLMCSFRFLLIFAMFTGYLQVGIHETFGTPPPILRAKAYEKKLKKEGFWEKAEQILQTAGNNEEGMKATKELAERANKIHKSLTITARPYRYKSKKFESLAGKIRAKRDEQWTVMLPKVRNKEISPSFYGVVIPQGLFSDSERPGAKIAYDIYKREADRAKYKARADKERAMAAKRYKNAKILNSLIEGAVSDVQNSADERARQIAQRQRELMSKGICPHCEGAGEFSEVVKCTMCAGVAFMHGYPGGLCPTCHGKGNLGVVNKHTCKSCNGDGKYKEE